MHNVAGSCRFPAAGAEVPPPALLSDLSYADNVLEGWETRRCREHGSGRGLASVASYRSRKARARAAAPSGDLCGRARLLAADGYSAQPYVSRTNGEEKDNAMISSLYQANE